MADEYVASKDEIEELARAFDRDEERAPRKAAERAAPTPVTDKPADAALVPSSDYTDQRRYRLGISNVDRYLGPLRPGGFTVVGARPGIGKTSLAEQIVIANGTERRVMFDTLEQTVEDVRDSILARLMGCTLDAAEREIREETDDYREAMHTLERMNIRLYKPRESRKRTAEALLKVAIEDKTDLLVIDYTRNIQGWSAGDAASAIVETFSQAVKDSRLHLVLIAQLKREAQGRRPTLDLLEDTGRLEQEADKVLLLYRPFLDDLTRDVLAEVIIAKNRRGRVNRCHTHWAGQMRSFYAMDEAEEAAAACCKPKQKTTRAPTPRADIDGRDDDDDLGAPIF